MSSEGVKHAADTAAGSVAASDDLSRQLTAVLRRCVSMVQASPGRWPEMTSLLLPYARVLQRRGSDGDAAAGSPVHARLGAGINLTPAHMDRDIDDLVEQLRVEASHDDLGALDLEPDVGPPGQSRTGEGGQDSGGAGEGKGGYDTDEAGKEADAVVVGEELLRRDSVDGQDDDGAGDRTDEAGSQDAKAGEGGCGGLGGDSCGGGEPAAPPRPLQEHPSAPSVMMEAETLLAELELDPDTAGGAEP